MRVEAMVKRARCEFEKHISWLTIESAAHTRYRACFAVADAMEL